MVTLHSSTLYSSSHYYMHCYELASLMQTSLFIGILTRQLSRKLENEGNVSPGGVKNFYKGVREFYTTAMTYVLEWLPVLKNAKFVNLAERASASISKLSYFLTKCIIITYKILLKELTVNENSRRFPTVLKYSSAAELNQVEQEFLQYQLHVLQETVIPETVWQFLRLQKREALSQDGHHLVPPDCTTWNCHFNLTLVWPLKGRRAPGSGCLMFEKLDQMATLSAHIASFKCSRRACFQPNNQE